MKLAHRVSLGGVQLDSIDDRIIINGIEIGAGKETVTAVNTGAGDGTRITGKRRDSVEVAVRFSMNIRPKSRVDGLMERSPSISGTGFFANIQADGMEERARVLEEINAWASTGGWLRIGYKPNRRLYVDEIVLPGEGDLWNWVNEYTIIFRAHAVPYWQENTAVTVTSKTKSSGTGSLLVAGSAKTVAECELINKSGKTINTATITIGGQTMSFTGLGLGGTDTLKIDHVITRGRNVIRIRIGTKSVLAKRTETSADDFEISPGECEFSYTAQRACQLTVTCRGRFA